MADSQSHGEPPAYERPAVRRPSTAEGTLAHEPRGDGGFGYDPAFIPADRDDGRTMAELTPDEKDAISHRGRALRELAKVIARELRHLPEGSATAPAR